MRKIAFLFFVACILFGAWWFNGHQQFSQAVNQYVENGEFTTLKARYTPEQIMDLHKKELLVDSKHSFQEPVLKYHPYLLLEVKYFLPDKKSREGMALWSQMDGEMVISTETWEMSHGFEDALNAGASRTDFKLMQAIAKLKGTTSFEQLQKELHLEKETLSLWVDSAVSKQLIVQKGNELQLHFQDPKILILPETKVVDWLVKKPYNNSQTVSGQYSANQILKNAKSAFGEDFSVRQSTEVFLPVYSLIVLNPDGSTLTTYWNAITGHRIMPRYSLKGW